MAQDYGPRDYGLQTSPGSVVVRSPIKARRQLSSRSRGTAARVFPTMWGCVASLDEGDRYDPQESSRGFPLSHRSPVAHHYAVPARLHADYGGTMQTMAVGLSLMPH